MPRRGARRFLGQDASLEILGGASELCKSSAQASGQLRQLFRAEDDQGNAEDDQEFGKADVQHAKTVEETLMG